MAKGVLILLKLSIGKILGPNKLRYALVTLASERALGYCKMECADRVSILMTQLLT